MIDVWYIINEKSETKYYYYNFYDDDVMGQKYCSNWIKKNPFVLYSLKLVSKVSNNEAYDIEESKLKSIMNKTLVSKYYEYDLYYDDELIKNTFLKSKWIYLPLCYLCYFKKNEQWSFWPWTIHKFKNKMR